MAPKKFKQQGKINLKLRKDTEVLRATTTSQMLVINQRPHPKMVADDKLKNATAKSEPGIEMTPGNHVPTQYPSKIMSFECPVVV